MKNVICIECKHWNEQLQECTKLISTYTYLLNKDNNCDLFISKSAITSENYTELANRTNAPVDSAIERIKDPKIMQLLHAAIGLSTEANEFLDMLKKHIFYGKPLDEINAKEEIGDSFWYAALAIDVLHTTINEIMSTNIEKLKKRYPEKFTSDDAINRNIENELSHFKK